MFHHLEFRLEEILVFRHKAVGIVDDVAGVVFHTELEPALRTYYRLPQQKASLQPTSSTLMRSAEPLMPQA